MTSVLLISDNSARSLPLAGLIKDRLYYSLRALPISALDALTKGEIGSFDILILDVGAHTVPELRGEIQMVRKAHPDICVLVLYPFGDVEAEAEAVNAGVDDMLARPVSFERLRLTLKNLTHLKMAQNMPLKPEKVVGLKDHYVPLLDGAGELKKLRHVETEVIAYALRHYQGQITKVANSLGVGRSTLYRKMEEMNLDAVSAA